MVSKRKRERVIERIKKAEMKQGRLFCLCDRCWDEILGVGKMYKVGHWIRVNNPMKGMFGEKHNRYGKDGWNKGLPPEEQPMFGIEPWNKGLTNETDERVRKHSESISGEKSPIFGRTGEKAPFYGKNHSEEAKKKIREGRIKYLEDHPKYLEKIIENLKKYLEDPVNRENRIRATLKASHKKPNKIEIQLQFLLDKILPGEYKFVGDGTVVIGGKCPDFINTNGQKKIIELFGDYWHKDENPEDRISYLKQFGYDTLVIWEHEFHDEIEKVIERILEFHLK